MTRTTVILLLSLSAFGCSGSRGRLTSYVYVTDNDPVSGRAVNIGQVAMPTGETFSGSYHSGQIGDLYLDQMNDIVTGTYEYDRAACHATGRIEGRVAGNLLRFTWTESQAACGRLQPLTGHGYFLFWLDHNDDGSSNGRLNGEWGPGDNESGGGPWSAFRDRVRRTAQHDQAPTSGGSVFEDANGPHPSGGTSGGTTPAPTP